MLRLMPAVFLLLASPSFGDTCTKHGTNEPHCPANCMDEKRVSAHGCGAFASWHCSVCCFKDCMKDTPKDGSEYKTCTIESWGTFSEKFIWCEEKWAYCREGACPHNSSDAGVLAPVA